MTEIIQYENLTFPEVAALPRDIPIVIPLGDVTEADLIKRVQRQARSASASEERAAPERICVFPSVPFGFEGSALAVDRQLFKPVIDSLVAGIEEDGFTNVRVIKTSRRFQNLREATSDCLALIATGHTEQHAFHLPLNTDTLIIDAIARGVEARMPDTIFRLPTFPYGVSMHRRQYPGTVTIDPRAWEDFWVAIVGRLHKRGLRMAYLVNGHGGNHSFLVNVTKFCGERWPEMFVATSFLHTTSAELTQYRTSQIGGMGHACELETSYILHLRPELVHLERAVDDVDFIATPNYYMDWIEGGALIANPPWTDDTISGAYGAATHATAEKGRLWLAAAIEEKLGHVQEIIEQQRRREERRAEGWVLGAWRKIVPPAA
ncbi:3-dehydro-scyllo-inosose hydrolase [Thermoflexales bacterium]|nr:3-dehydro-scyllo-inosose hydrolase [Thermoflexales bacterium]